MFTLRVFIKSFWLFSQKWVLKIVPKIYRLGSLMEVNIGPVVSGWPGPK